MTSAALADDYDEAEAAEAVGLYRQFNDYVRTGDGWQQVEQARPRGLEKGWIPTYLDLPPSPDHWQVGFWKGMLD